MKNKLIVFSVFTLAMLLSHMPAAHSQVLISLILGDDLNSDKIEFGLDGGIAFTNMNGLPTSDFANSLHLGFYFDIKMKENWQLHTGVIVKSTMGATGLPSYTLGDENLDLLLADAEVRRNLSYFSIPALAKYHFPNSHFFVEAGPQLGLRYKAVDQFTGSILDKDDLEYNNKIGDDYKRFDLGITSGVGYRLMHGHGMNIGMRYYLGLMNIAKSGESLKNNAIYLYVGIPIGAGKAEEKRSKKTN
ncbi:hypothetical protein GCM10007049_05560 [Echinicola pacifica]|uniref:Outer membrane protein beta-barrel domain-containing protein n=1 Tax=Echinicola pacifica TaxID=346377 RepID=A0A918UK24_9BACT|nr:porin family protein [Echinicola pacifica]GGZ16177.1 hypothetical protein GCM10007049_05560 [Echinicola pacifica]